MRILMITPSFHPSVGGVETHVLRVSERLAAAGHQVSVVTQADQASQERLGGLRVHRLQKAGWFSAWRAARPHIAAADVVHCHDAYSFLHFYLPSCWLPPRRPAFVTFHGYEQHPIPTEALRRRRVVRKRARNAICIGEFICKHYHTPCFAVSYGGVGPVPNPPPLPSVPAALFIGRLAEDTSIMTYLEAVWVLRKDYGHDLFVDVAGDGPLRAPAERYAQAHRVRAHFHGVVADPRPLFAGAAFAFVSGYLSIWQALAMKRLVFAVYENPLKRDYLTCFPEAESVLLMAKEAQELARQLARHCADPERGQAMRERGARLAAEQTWERVAETYLAMYRAHDLG